MKQKLLSILFLGFSLVGFSQTTSIPDANFEQALIDLGHDTIIDGQVLTANISSLTSLVVTYRNISDLTGIEDFTALNLLYCNGNQLTNLEISNNPLLTTLLCNDNQLTNLDVSSATSLVTFYCNNNQITSIDVSSNINLQGFRCQ